MSTPRTRATTAAARPLVAGLAGLAAVAVLLGLTGCSAGGQAPSASPRQTLTAVKRNLDRTSGVHILLATDDLPTGVSGVLSADGVGTHAPAFQGDIRVKASGLAANAKVIAVGGTVYAVLPFTSRYEQINPADYGAPDPAALMSSTSGLSSLLTSARHAARGKQTRDGARVLSTYTATVPGKQVATIIPSASASGTFDATFTVDDHNVLDKAVLTGPFYPKSGDVTYTITFSDYGTKKHITAP